MKETRNFNLDKPTKNTGKYQEVTQNGADLIGQLYIQKAAFAGDLPKEITVTIEA